MGMKEEGRNLIAVWIVLIGASAITAVTEPPLSSVAYFIVGAAGTTLLICSMKGLE